MPDSRLRLLFIFLVGCVVGVAGGLFGVGGGVLLVPLLVLLFQFNQHEAQGTSLVALVPPTGLLGFLNYYHAGQVDWTVGLLLMPGVFFGGILGSKLAQTISPRRMRQIFAGFLLLMGVWQVADAWFSKR
jgi:hypothetical protein